MTRYRMKPAGSLNRENHREESLAYRVKLLYQQLDKIYGTQKLIMKASKLDAVEYMNSDRLEHRVLALQKILQEDPTLDMAPPPDQILNAVKHLEALTINLSARKAVEDELQKRIQRRMKEKYSDYVREIEIQTLKEINHSPENAQTLKELGKLEKMEHNSLQRSALEILRPENLSEVIGQQKAVRTLMAEMSSPYPQHVLLYGPPGVGKTTCARLALSQAKESKTAIFKKDAPFIEVNGTTLRWDPKESTDPLLGSVHDPIYQGAKKELAEDGIPEPKMGLVSEAHGGILFIDEIGDMEPLLQSKLLKVMEDKRVFFESSYYNPQNERIPQYIKNIFDRGIPADFVLIGATTQSPADINPAFRSRCLEVFFEPLSAEQIKAIVLQSAHKLNIRLEDGAADIISQYSNDGRGANKIMVMAYDFALSDTPQNDNAIVRCEHVHEAISNSRMLPSYYDWARSDSEEGRVLGLGARGYMGTVLEIEAVSFPADNPGDGHIRFNETAGSMTRDSVFNAASVFRKEFNENLNNYDVHINVIGGGKVDGPSAGAAIYLAILSAVKHWPVRQDTAITGELSIQGKVKPVGAINEKVTGARQAGLKEVIIPYENLKDIASTLTNEIKITPVKDINEAGKHIFSSFGKTDTLTGHTIEI
ncbi:MAG TPA: Lon family ATP-dependent protease [Syntrophomonadaceae bacterium]|nr:Lon family ATP-dependent protease [Syntrophomonadaceae bacterium]